MIHASLLAAVLFASTGDDPLALKPAWKASVGSAYSRVAASGETVVTQGGDGEQDFICAVNARDGKVRWKHTLGPTYLGHDGSKDGPVSTPVIGADAVFAVGPRGELIALDAATGEERWSTHLVEDLGAKAPDYGFTTTPVLEGDLVIVQAGGAEDRNLCAFDAASGELRWSVTAGEAAYQSPMVLDLAGRRQVVVLNDKELVGVAPESGEVLWTHALPGARDSAGSGRAGAIDGERFFLYVSGQIAVFRITPADDGFAIEPLFRTRELGGTYAEPVYHDGHLYGFKGTFLTCVDATTGKRVWKSRPPGGRGLVLVGDRLVVFGSEGIVVIAPATPDGYQEESSVQALEYSSYTWPTSADGRVFVRNDAQLACLTIVSADEATLAAETSEPEHGAPLSLEDLAELLGTDPTSPDFLADDTASPILRDGLAHFFYRGDARDVAIVGSMTGGSRAEPMSHLPGTDIFYTICSIEPGARWEYQLQVDFDRPIPDPRNPRTVPGGRGEFSEVVTPGYERPAHLADPTGPRGRMDTFQFESEQLANEREIRVYLPPGYDDGDTRYPVLFVHEGPDWLEKGAMQTALDNLVETRVRPLVAVFISPMDQWWFEAGGSRTEEYLTMLATEFVPLLESRYRLSPAPADRALFGTSSFGLTSVLGVALHPDVFGKAAAQSISLEDVARHAFFERLRTDPPAGALFYIDWNRYESYDPDRGYDYGAFGPAVSEALKAAGCTVRGGEALDCHGWTSWSSRLDDVLVALFPRG